MTASRLKNSIRNSFVAAISLCIGVWSYQAIHRDSPPNQPTDNIDLVGTPAPVIALGDLNNQSLNLSDWQGSIVLVNFWASWCKTCKIELPLLNSLQNRYRDRGLRVLGVGIDEAPALRKFLREFSVDYPIVASTFNLMELYGNVRGTLPYSVLIDRKGIIAEQYFRLPNSQTLENQIRQLLKVDSNS